MLARNIEELRRLLTPDPKALCDQCRHRFGNHYVTFDKQAAGCSDKTQPRANAAICRCNGFMVLWQPEMAHMVYDPPPQAALTSGQAAVEVLGHDDSA